MTGEARLSQSIYQSLIGKISSIIGLDFSGSEFFLFMVLVYAALIIILGFIHNIVKKSYKNNKKNFVLECDQIIYQLAQEQHNNKYAENINISLLESLFSSKTKDYFNDKEIFISKIKEIEAKQSKNIIEQSQRSSFQKSYKKTKITKIFSKIIGWILTILTIGIYRVLM